MMAKSPLLERLREAIRVRHYSIRTEKSYVQWVKRFILFHGKRHPAEMGAEEISACPCRGCHAKSSISGLIVSL
jgi:hypothetical protein